MPKGGRSPAAHETKADMRYPSSPLAEYATHSSKAPREELFRRMHMHPKSRRIGRLIFLTLQNLANWTKGDRHPHTSHVMSARKSLRLCVAGRRDTEDAPRRARLPRLPARLRHSHRHDTKPASVSASVARSIPVASPAYSASSKSNANARPRLRHVRPRHQLLLAFAPRLHLLIQQFHLLLGRLQLLPSLSMMSPALSLTASFHAPEGTLPAAS